MKIKQILLVIIPAIIVSGIVSAMIQSDTMQEPTKIATIEDVEIVENTTEVNNSCECEITKQDVEEMISKAIAEIESINKETKVQECSLGDVLSKLQFALSLDGAVQPPELPVIRALLKGDKGDRGEQGERGDNGISIMGEKGEKGNDGIITGREFKTNDLWWLMPDGIQLIGHWEQYCRTSGGFRNIAENNPCHQEHIIWLWTKKHWE